jgi:hypothetical protein
MKKTTEQLILVIGVAISSSILTVLVGFVCMMFYVIQPYQKEAVDRGFASWDVVDNATGSTKFSWNVLAESLHPANSDILGELEKPLE